MDIREFPPEIRVFSDFSCGNKENKLFFTVLFALKSMKMIMKLRKFSPAELLGLFSRTLILSNFTIITGRERENLFWWWLRSGFIDFQDQSSTFQDILFRIIICFLWWGTRSMIGNKTR